MNFKKSQMNRERSWGERIGDIISSKGLTAAALGLTAVTSLAIAGKLTHDMRHPEIRVGVTDSDVDTLAEMLEESSLTPYRASTSGSEADTSLMRAVIRVQAANPDKIEDESIGKIREGDDTWDVIKDSKLEGDVEVPPECTGDGNVICIEKDPISPSGTLTVLQDGNPKISIEDVGVGKPSEPTDVGEFKVNPARMFETYFSRSAPYEGVPMPYSVFYNGGEAIHFSATKAAMGKDYPGSGGCVTIGSIDAARSLYNYIDETVLMEEVPSVIVTEGY